MLSRYSQNLNKVLSNNSEIILHKINTWGQKSKRQPEDSKGILKNKRSNEFVRKQRNQNMKELDKL